MGSSSIMGQSEQPTKKQKTLREREATKIKILQARLSNTDLSLSEKTPIAEKLQQNMEAQKAIEQIVEYEKIHPESPFFSMSKIAQVINQINEQCLLVKTQQDYIINLQ